MSESGDDGEAPRPPRSAHPEPPGGALAREESARASVRASRGHGPRYSAHSAGLLIEVEPMFLESQSFPELDHFLWAYRVTIRNQRSSAVRLTDRYWRLTDKAGVCREVRGEGVVGETPLIEPGAAFVYTSSAPLPTPSGMMEGEYGLRGDDGERFTARIPAFSLDSQHDRRTLN